MPVSKIHRLEVASFHLDVPVKAFEHLPRELGCSLQRSGTELRLASEQPGCELRFSIAQDTARLAQVIVGDDVQGRFTRKVLGVLLARFQGSLEALLHWEPQTTEDSQLLVMAGESSHPLLAKPPMLRPAEADVVEQLLEEGRSAWAEYLRLKSERAGHENNSR